MSVSGGETIVRTASLGLELADELSDDAILGGNRVRVFRASAPDQELRPTTFLVGASRWVFENLPTTEEVRLVIESDLYFGETLETGQTLPTLVEPAPGGVSVPSLTTPAPDGRFVRVRLRPRTGYPFSTAFTRVVGSVLLAGAPVVGADVTVTPRYQVGTTPGSSTPGSPAFATLTSGDGQFVAWLFPNIAEDNPAPVAFDAAVTFGAATGSVTDRPIVPQTVNGVTIPLT